MNALQIFKISNNLGDAKSLVTHPATTTHQRLTPEARAELGIFDNSVRLSIGLEDVRDLMADLDQALVALAAQELAARSVLVRRTRLVWRDPVPRFATTEIAVSEVCHVPEHQDALQFRPARHGRGDLPVLAAIRAEAERLHAAVDGQSSRLRPRGGQGLAAPRAS